MPIVVRKGSQVVGLLLLMSTLLLVLSVSMYAPDAPNANYYVSDGSTMRPHRGGVVEAVLAMQASLADWVLQGFGSAVALLAGIAVIDAWYLLRGRLYTAVAVAGRGLLCLVAVSACAYLTFTSDPIWGTNPQARIWAGGMSGKLLADSVVDVLRSGMVGFAGGSGGKWLTEGIVASLSRSGAYAILGMIALVALDAGGKHPILTALWHGFRMIIFAGWTLLWLVPQGLAWIGWAVYQGRKHASAVLAQQS